MTRVAIVGGMVVAAAIASAIVCASSSAIAQSNGPTLSSQVPHDVDLTGVPPDQQLSTVADFSWRSFIALAWPARADGTPDPSRQIGQGGDADAVFDHWPIAEDVFPATATPPPWGSKPVIPAVCASATRVVTMIAKAPISPGGGIVSGYNQLTTGPLIDQNGAYVRYAVQMNQDAFNYIVANKLYTTQGQQTANSIGFPSGTSSLVGAITTKAAWKVLGANDDATRFHQIDAWVYTPATGTTPANCVKQTLGLVGLHIAHKTATRPQWIWSTFEQVDNAPPDTAKRAATFFNPGCTSRCTPNAMAQQPWNPLVKGMPVQVTRMNPLTALATAANAAWQPTLRGVDARSPWQYYMLVDTQWPTRPSDPNLGSPTPDVLANTVIETFIQSGPPSAGSSCVYCHNGATAASSSKPSDFSYLLQRANHTGGA
jgi:hypothetical protein